MFQLLIKPVGDRCNLRCRYCFYSGGPTRLPEDGEPGAVMPYDILETMTREFLSLRLPQSTFCWQGGEPALAGLDFFRRAVELQIKHGAPAQAVANAFQTNGALLDRDWARFLAEYKFLVGLSLDGPRDVHEPMRGKSFDAAMRAAQLLRQFGVEFNILSVVSRANVMRGAEVYRWFVGRGFHNLQFIPCHFPQAGGPPEYAITGEEFGGFLIDVFDEWWRSGIRRVSERNIDSLLSTLMCRRPLLCTHGEDCADYLLVERDGSVFPCDFYAGPEWRLGGIGERPLGEFMERRRSHAFGRLKAEGAARCGGCEFLALCRGGCPHDADGSGRTRYCAGYKRFFAAAAPRLRQLARATPP